METGWELWTGVAAVALRCVENTGLCAWGKRIQCVQHELESRVVGRLVHRRMCKSQCRRALVLPSACIELYISRGSTSFETT